MPAERPRRKEVMEWRLERTCSFGDEVSWEMFVEGLRGETYAVVVLDRFGNEGVNEEGDFLFCWWHFRR